MSERFFRVGGVSFFLRSHKVDISQQGGPAGDALLCPWTKECAILKVVFSHSSSNQHAVREPSPVEGSPARFWNSPSEE